MAMKGTYFDGKAGRLNVESIFLVEGQDDAIFFDQLLSNTGADANSVGICYVEGKDKFADFLKTVLISSAFTSGRIKKYALIRDSDDDPARAANEVADALRRLGEPTPNCGSVSPRPDGRKVGFYLLPGCGQPGDLEELCMRTVNGQPKAVAVDNHINSVEQAFGPLHHRSKRVAQSYLAIAADELVRGVGLATKKGVFPINSAALGTAEAFLKTFLTA